MSARHDIWIISGSRQGDLNQMVDLADATRLPYLVKTIARPSKASSAADIRSLLAGEPSPRLVISAERTVTDVALGVKSESRGATKAVSIGRPGSRIDEFDLVITAPHFRVRPAPNVLELAIPLHTVDPIGMRRSADALVGELEGLPRPFTVALVGGSSGPTRLDEATAASLARRLSERIRFTGGSLLLTTSPRTSPAAAQAITRNAGAPSKLFVWSRDMPVNPYKGLLELADEFVATSDSASMPIEAALTGKPVYLYELPRVMRLREFALEAAHHSRNWAPPIDALFRKGALQARADRRRLFEPLIERGVLRRFSPDAERWSPSLLESSVEPAAAAVIELIGARE